MSGYVIKSNSKETGITLNILAREQFKLKLLEEIRMDIEVSKLEKIDYYDYLLELKEIIDSFINCKNRKEVNLCGLEVKIKNN